MKMNLLFNVLSASGHKGHRHDFLILLAQSFRRFTCVSKRFGMFDLPRTDRNLTKYFKGTHLYKLGMPKLVSRQCVYYHQSCMSRSVGPEPAFYHTHSHNSVGSLRVQHRSETLMSCRSHSNKTDVVLNPIEELNKYVAVPLLPQNQVVFNPSMEEIRNAQSLFMQGPKHEIKFLSSCLWEDQLPKHDLPEVAFVGRSNVGKSSLIKIILSAVDDVEVRVSKRPGSTKKLNFFQVGDALAIVDMPGYGYNMPAHYSKSVEQFLTTRKKLCRTFLLIDSTAGVTEKDVVGFNMLEEFRIPYVVSCVTSIHQRMIYIWEQHFLVMTFLLIDAKVGPTPLDEKRLEVLQAANINFCMVMTKIDKTRPSLLLKNFMSVMKYVQQTHYCCSQPFLISSIDGDGVPMLQAFIAYVTGNLKIKDG